MEYFNSDLWETKCISQSYSNCRHKTGDGCYGPPTGGIPRRNAAPYVSSSYRRCADQALSHAVWCYRGFRNKMVREDLVITCSCEQRHLCGSWSEFGGGEGRSHLRACRRDPHVIDEWQRVPAVWDTVRHAVDDAGGARGLWILTGSSTPRKGEVAHSGAGRYGRIRMHPCTLQESGDSTGAISLSGLFEGKFRATACPSSVVELSRLICRGGWPDALDASAADAQSIVREYLDAIFEQSIPLLGGDPALARRLVRSLARTLGQSASNVTLAQDVFMHEEKKAVTDVEQREISRHLGLLLRIYLLDDVEGWVPATRSPRRMRTSPKRYFADPSMAISLLGMNESSLLQDWQTFGLLFENLCMRDLDVYARAMELADTSPVRYYHDDSGLEIDAVVELCDGRWGAFEIKLSQEKVDDAAKHLVRMRDKLLKNSHERIREPEFLAVLLGVGEAAYKRPDGVLVIPLRALGA